MELAGEIRIEAPVSGVFAYVDDWRNTTKYLHGLVRWEPVSPQRAQGLGAHFRVSIKVGPVTLDGEMEVTEHEPDARVGFRSVNGPRVHGWWVFRPDGDAARVELHNDFDLPGGMLGRTVERFVRSQGEKDLRRSLARLKQLVETGG